MGSPALVGNSRAGSQASKIDAALGSTPLTATEIAAKAGATPSRTYSHLKHLLAKGLIRHKEGKYSLKPSASATAPVPSSKRPQPKPAKAPAKRQSQRPATSGKPLEPKAAQQAASRAISTRQPGCALEYTSRGKRVTKRFAPGTAHLARSMYARLLREGKEPKVKAL